MRLGTLLLRDAVISLTQLEEALRAQILYGGRLGTNLVELGSLDLDTLGLYLSKSHGVPVATAARMEAADPGAVARLGPELADRHTAFPLGPEPLHPDMIAVALADPRPSERIDEISARLGCQIAPYVAAEMRILYHIEKHYGRSRPPRYLRPGSDDAGAAPPGTGERRRTRPPSARVAPVVRFEPRKRAGQPERPRREKPPRVTAVDATRSIDAAGHRDQIAQDLMELAQGRLGAAALLIVRGKSAIGWRGMAPDGRAMTGDRIEQLALPLGGSSSLQIAFDTHRPYHGPSPAAGRPVERQLWQALGVSEPPRDMLVVPILVGQRVVNLLYGHGPGGAEITSAHVTELIDACQHTAAAYLRLIQAARAQNA